MTNFADPFFWLNFLYFFVAIFVAFYIPGALVLKKLHLTTFQKFVLGTVVGMVLWGWQGAIFGYLGFRQLSYLYLFLMVLLWLHFVVKQKNAVPHFKSLLKEKIDWLLLILVIFGMLIQMGRVWFTGALSQEGFFFCCGNESDALFHAALTRQIIEHFPPFQPGMYGEIVHNYHYWSNLVVAELIRVFKLPLLATQFQYAMVFVSLFLGLTAIVFGQLVKAKKLFIAWLLFFLYFGGDLVYLILQLYGTGFNFTVGSLEDGVKFLENPPRAFSIVVFFAGLSLLVLWIKRRYFLTGFLMALLLGSAIGFKVYTGLFALVGLLCLGLYFLVRKEFSMVLPLIVAPLFAALVYLPVNKGSGGLYFTGLWIFENFRTIKDFRLERLEYAKLIYYQHNNWPRIIQYELLFAGLYIVSTFGTKLIGLFQTKKSFSLLPREIHVFLIPAIIVSLVIGLFFQQESGGANSFNFLVSVFIIGSIYTALTATYITEKLPKSIAPIFIMIIIFLTIPRVVYESMNNVKRLNNHEGFVITNAELGAYKYLKEHTNKNDQIISAQFGITSKSPYMSLFTEKRTFLSGEGILVSHAIDISERQSIQNEILKGTDPVHVESLLLKNDIDYIMIDAIDTLPTEQYPEFVEQVFQNERMRILKPLHDKKYMK